MAVIEWVALVVAFCIFFGTIISKHVEHCNFHKNKKHPEKHCKLE